MPRIVAGEARGRRLLAPRAGTRPTSDRAREGLFSTLAGMLDLGGARVLDLYAGTGALGLEALSRGAAAVLLVESDQRAARVLGRNLDAVGLPGARVAVDRVARTLASRPGEPYDLVLADPPYALGEEDLTDVLEALLRNGWVCRGSVLVVERSSRGPALRWPAGIEAVKTRGYGEGTLWYGRAT